MSPTVVLACLPKLFWKVSSLRSFIFTSLLLFVGSAGAAPADYLISLVRHGDRSPRELGDQGQYWPMGAGQLTDLGMAQMSALGREIREKYFLSDFPEVWNPRFSRHYAKGINRTIQSASALLQGFYTSGKSRTGLSGDIQLPPVFASPLEQDVLFSAQHICPRYQQLRRQLEQSPSWKEKQAQYQTKLKKWAKIAGSDSDIYSLLLLMDRAAIHLNRGMDLPEGLSKEDAIDLEELLNWVLAQLGGEKQLGQLVTAPLVKAMIKDLQLAGNCLASGSKDCLRWSLYVASDVNLLTLMGVLGVPRDRNVDYASHLEIQLNWHPSTPSVSLYFNHEPLSVPGCGVRCGLGKWLETMDKSLPENWESLCAGSDHHAIKHKDSLLTEPDS